MLPITIIQSLMFLFRTSSYNWAYHHQLISKPDGSVLTTRAVVLNGITGTISEIVCSPFNVIKRTIRVRRTFCIGGKYMTSVDNVKSAVKHIYKNYGVFGFGKGISAVLPFGFCRYTSQVIVYYTIKDYLIKHDIYTSSEAMKCLASSLCGAPIVCCITTPLDICIRQLQTQPRSITGRGILYSGFRDCLAKLYKNEGIYGCYKGFGLMYIRMGPATIASMLLWDSMTHGYMHFLGEERLHTLHLKPKKEK